MIGKAVLRLIKTFSKQGHSGFSAHWVRELFNKLANWETITPITPDPDEWDDTYDRVGDGEKGVLWQNKRNPAIFSNDGGKTWWHVDGDTLEEGIEIALKEYDRLNEGHRDIGGQFGTMGFKPTNTGMPNPPGEVTSALFGAGDYIAGTITDGIKDPYFASKEKKKTIKKSERRSKKYKKTKADKIEKLMKFKEFLSEEK